MSYQKATVITQGRSYETVKLKRTGRTGYCLKGREVEKMTLKF